MNSLTAVNTIDVVLSDVSYKATWKLYSGTGSNKTEIASKKINLQDLPRRLMSIHLKLTKTEALKLKHLKLLKDSNSAITKLMYNIVMQQYLCLLTIHLLRHQHG